MLMFDASSSRPSWHIFGLRLPLFASLVLCLIGSTFIHAQDFNDQVFDEQLAQLHQSVAEVVPGILGYARWPGAETEVPKRLCVVGPTEYADMLLRTDLAVPGWEPRVQRVGLDYGRIASDCQALYVGTLLESERQTLFARIRDQAILTISEQNDACTRFTLFCLRARDTNVGFEVNLDSVERSGIRVNPNVLRLGSRSQESP